MDKKRPKRKLPPEVRDRRRLEHRLKLLDERIERAIFEARQVNLPL